MKILTYMSPIFAAIVLPFVSACCFYKISLIVSVWLKKSLVRGLQYLVINIFGNSMLALVEYFRAISYITRSYPKLDNIIACSVLLYVAVRCRI